MFKMTPFTELVWSVMISRNGWFLLGYTILNGVKQPNFCRKALSLLLHNSCMGLAELLIGQFRDTSKSLFHSILLWQHDFSPCSVTQKTVG